MTLRNTLRSAFAFLLCPIWSVGQAQNLVPNPSFEDITLCPYTWAQVDSAVSWDIYRASPDLFNACSPGGYGTTNVFGTRPAADGEGYVGMYCYYASLFNRREYVGAPLINPLVPGLPTNISFKVASAGGGGEVFSMQYWVSGIGIKFSMEPWYEAKPTMTISNSAAVWSTAVIDYQPDWTTVSGVYVPDSAYAYVVVGNFFGDNDITIASASGTTPAAYYFVDDICVSQGTTAPCLVTAGMQEPGTGTVGAWYDPLGGMVRITLPSGASPTAVDLLDATGRVARRTRVLNSNSVFIDATGLVPGVYLVRAEGSGRSRPLFIGQ